MKRALALILPALALYLIYLPAPAEAQVTLTEVDPPDGAELEAPPDFIHLCFSQPVITDNVAFDFAYLTPEGRGLGQRIVFEPDGDCVDLFINVPETFSAGEYTLQWQVTAAEGDEVGSGTLAYDVTQSGAEPSPTPQPTITGPLEVIEVEPTDGATLEAPPDPVGMCFSRPVNIDDPDSFEFTYALPNGRAVGMRIRFQPDGLCVDLFPGLPAERPAGEYVVDWKVTAAGSDEEASGTLRYRVTRSSAVTPPPAETPIPASPEPGDEVIAPEDDEDGPDILTISLITIGSIGGAAVLFTLGYLLRRRIGYEPHRPPDVGDDDTEAHQ